MKRMLIQFLLMLIILTGCGSSKAVETNTYTQIDQEMAKNMLEGPKLVAEGAGATGIAAFLCDRINTELRTMAVVSGGNVDISTLERIITNVRERRKM